VSGFGNIVCTVLLIFVDVFDCGLPLPVIISLTTYTIPFAKSTTTKPISVYWIIFAALGIFLGSPCENINCKPPHIIITIAIGIDIQNIKLIILSIILKIDVSPRGFGISIVSSAIAF